ncbi:hypothetical protein QF034_000237 [Streptomyces africanus]|uniref:Uncharacterized protein n=1 Tax=Streptomyces africanus TaxID=231024 RepID=A0ABU0QF35_9ACTN|nr:hypothetical protein [Streptomyces africanus]
MAFAAPDGQRVMAGQNMAAIEDTLGPLDGSDQVASTTDPHETGAVSEDGTIAYSTITYTADAVDLTDPTKSALEDERRRPPAGRSARPGPPSASPARPSSSRW